ncbi:hypothetical protein [Polynucleobacter necessarius]|uniref:hypothetical protein n=1 Tax=Polynucleobacter necessarius TaxID=576610 RepID=UPI000E09592C|nr:hypothetical protein [Polynucleobacter necessarius]
MDGKISGVITERVASVGSTIVIEHADENGSPLASEIQDPCGTVQLDTSWPRLMSFKPPPSNISMKYLTFKAKMSLECPIIGRKNSGLLQKLCAG